MLWIKKTILAAVGLLTAAAAVAIPARPGLTKIYQSDGTELAVQLAGDERLHYTLSADGYLLLDVDGVMRYAVPGADGKPVPSSLKAVEPERRTPRERALLAGMDTRAMIDAFVGERAGDMRKKGPGLFFNASFPTTGEQRAIVVLVEYADVKFRLADPADYFSRMLNEEGFGDYGATGSARDYYLQNSEGRFNPHFDVYGPVTLPHPMAWYGGNEAGRDGTNARMMVVDACNILNPQVDFTQYDRDGDGTIDNVFLFYAGLGEATGGGADTVWPHSADVLGSYSYDGKMLKTYGCTNEWVMETATTGHPDAIGTFCHEFGHVLGLPDLYATTYPTPAPFTPGSWALMDVGAYNNGSRTPPALELFSRYALGWYDPVVLDSPADVRLAALSEGGRGYLVPTGDNDEYFLLENRQRTGWDRYLPGHGLLVWHVEYNTAVWMNHTVNNDARHQYVDILEADGTQNESTRSGDTFPGAAGVTSITGATTPGFVTAAGAPLAMTIDHIAEAPDGIVTFQALGGATPAPAVAALPAEDITPRSFTARWTAVDGAVDYILTVTDADGSVNGYDGRSTGADACAFTVTGLEPGTAYAYTVAVVMADRAGLPSDPVEVTTAPLTFDFALPGTPVASQIKDNSFVAEWPPVDGATDYLVSVSRRSVSDATLLTERFDGKKAEWATNSNYFYSAESYVGESAPSLRLTPGQYVMSPMAEGGSLHSLSFWHRARNAGQAWLSVDVYAGGCWRTVCELDPVTDKGGATLTAPLLPADAVAVRMMLRDPSGEAQAYVDDFALLCGGTETVAPVADYTGRSTSGATRLAVDGLAPGTEYLVAVTATDGTALSLPSAPCHVTTSGQSGIADITADPCPARSKAVHTPTGSVSVDGPARVYDVCGRQVTVTRGAAALSLAPGTYFVTSQSTINKQHKQ